MELGGHVRKGETGELVVFASRITRTETSDEGESTEREIPFLKGYTVFNAEQCEGLPRRHTRLLRDRAGLCADAALRDLPRRRELRRHAGP